MLTSKFMKSQLGSPTIAIHILPDISQSKDNQTMKFDQLIHEVTTWFTNNCNTHIARYLTK